MLIPVLWLATWLAARMLNYDAIWVDEFLTYRITGTGAFPAHSILETLRLSVVDSSWWPPAYFLMLQAHEWLLGSHLFLDRLSALFIGLFGICFVFQLGTRLKNAQTGLYSAALLGLSAFYIFYMHELRGYSLFITMTTLHALVYIVCLDPAQFEKKYVRYGLLIVTALTMYSHYLAAFSILGVGIYHLTCERHNPNYSRIIKYSINGLILFVPWIATTILTVRSEASLDRALPVGTYIFSLLYSLSNSLVPIIVLAMLYSLRLLKTKAVRFLWIWGAVNLAAALISNVWLSFLFHPRHISSLFAALSILTVLVLQDIRQRWRIPALMIVSGIWIGAGIAFSYDSQFMNSIPRHVSQAPKDAVNKMVNIVDTCVRDDDTVLLTLDENYDAWISDFYPQYYFKQSNATYVHLGSVVTDTKGELGESSMLIPQEISESPFVERIEYYTDNRDRIWLFSLPDLPAQDDVAYLTAELVQLNFIYCPIIDDNDLFTAVYLRGNNPDGCALIQQSCGHNSN